MSTHRIAWAIRAGMVAVVAAAGLVGLASPALAAAPDVQITSLSSGTLVSGGDATTLKYTVSDVDGGSANVKIVIDLGEVTCSGKCDFTETVDGNPRAFSATLKANGVPAGTQKTGRITITAEVDGEAATATRDITAKGPTETAAPTVPKVSGVVRNVSDSKPVVAATVFINDSANNTFSTGTDNKGRFTITATGNKPIVPGAMGIIVEKDGFQKLEKATVGVANQPLVLDLRMTATADPSASATAAPSETPTASAEEVVVVDDDSVALTDKDKSTGLTWIVIGLGLLLVALGAGAIVLLLRRRGDDGDDENGSEVDAPSVRPGGPTRTPGARGGAGPGLRPGPPGAPMGSPGMAPGGGPMGQRPHLPDATSVMNPGAANDATALIRRTDATGPTRTPDQTVVSRSPLVDAPTQLHSQLPPEYADPYTSPARPAQGGGGGGGYGYPGSGPGYPEQYPRADQGSYPSSPPGYGASAPPPRNPGSSYGQPTPGQGDGGYGAQNTQQYPGGYDQGYGANNPAGAGGYGGYGGSGGYGGAGYDQGPPSRHGQGGGAQPGGYDPAGYDEFGNPRQPGQPGQR